MIVMEGIKDVAKPYRYEFQHNISCTSVHICVCTAEIDVKLSLLKILKVVVLNIYTVQ